MVLDSKRVVTRVHALRVTLCDLLLSMNGNALCSKGDDISPHVAPADKSGDAS